MHQNPPAAHLGKHRLTVHREQWGELGAQPSKDAVVTRREAWVTKGYCLLNTEVDFDPDHLLSRFLQLQVGEEPPASELGLKAPRSAFG